MMKSYRNSYWAYFLMYTFYFLSWALFSALISVYLFDLGYKASQVSLVVSISFVASMISQPVIGWLNDRLGLKQVTGLLLVLTLLGGLIMILTTDFLWIVLAYSWVLLLINGSVPVMERIATTSPFSYGKIRVWGTVGFAVGSQIAGVIYDYISPKAMFFGFLLSMCLCLFGLWGTVVDNQEKSTQVIDSKAEQSIGQQLLGNPTYLLYLLLALIFAGVTNTGHTYIPAMLAHDGLSVGMATGVLALSVLFESPLILLSSKFMDQLTSRRICQVMLILLLIQYGIYSLELGLTSKVVITLLAKHTASMLFIMVNMKIVASLVSHRYLITALSFVQVARSLGSILIQNIVGYILDHSNYTVMNWFLTAISLLSFILLFFIKLPSGRHQALFK